MILVLMSTSIDFLLTDQKTILVISEVGAPTSNDCMFCETNICHVVLYWIRILLLRCLFIDVLSLKILTFHEIVGRDLCFFCLIL